MFSIVLSDMILCYSVGGIRLTSLSLEKLKDVEVALHFVLGLEG